MIRAIYAVILIIPHRILFDLNDFGQDFNDFADFNGFGVDVRFCFWIWCRFLCFLVDLAWMSMLFSAFS